MYTGNTFIKIFVIFGVTVYPCVYREHLVVQLVTAAQLGLSLCIQGTPPKVRFIPANVRFIPVYTGNTNLKNSSGSDFTVYPCVYREHTLCIDSV